MRGYPVLTIAGSDSSGGAGIQADLKTMTMLGCYGMSAITALTAQNTTGVREIHPVPAAFLQAQIAAVCDDVPQIHAIAEMVQHYRLTKLVLDPVMIATSGASLLRSGAQKALKENLFSLAALITPNIPEAEVLTGTAITSPEQMEQAALQLSAQFRTAILLKGGHAAAQCDDVLAKDGSCIWLHGERVPTTDTHGTGCTLSSAIASHLALGFSLEESVRRAKAYLTQALQAGLHLGHGNGPIAHNAPSFFQKDAI